MGFANLLAQEYKIATYQGKVVVKNRDVILAVDFTEAQADNAVENNLKWGDIKEQSNVRLLSGILFEDSSPVAYPGDCVLYEDVPDDTELYFVLEPAFVVNQ